MSKFRNLQEKDAILRNSPIHYFPLSSGLILCCSIFSSYAIPCLSNTSCGTPSKHWEYSDIPQVFNTELTGIKAGSYKIPDP